MTSKIFRSTFFVVIVILLCAIGIILGVLYGYFDDVQIGQLKDELRLAAIGTEESGLSFLKRIESDHFRLTWVASDGTVIYDTHKDASALETMQIARKYRKHFRLVPAKIFAIPIRCWNVPYRKPSVCQTEASLEFPSVRRQ